MRQGTSPVPELRKLLSLSSSQLRQLPAPDLRDSIPRQFSPTTLGEPDHLCVDSRRPVSDLHIPGYVPK